MKKFVIKDSFQLENLVQVDAAEPEPGPGQVLLKMKAVSLNYRDLMLVRGTYAPKQPLPLVPCSDGVGEVVAVGDGVTSVDVGNRVCPTFHQGWLKGRPCRDELLSSLGSPLDGTLAQYMIVKEEGLVHAPNHLTDEEAATLPCAAVTAWTALAIEGDLKAGDTLLTLGTGGVSIFGLQLARLLGARVIITSSSDTKLEKARKLGAAFGINYNKDPNWGRTAKEFTGGVGVDHVLELAGAKTLEESLQSIRSGGTVSVIGVISGTTYNLNIVPILYNQAKIHGIYVGHRAAFEDMNRAIEMHKMKPVVDRVFEFDDAPAAFQYLAEAKHVGKIVIRIG